MKVTFLLLAHQHPRIIQRLMTSLTAAGHSVVVHYDQNASDADFESLKEAFAEAPDVRFSKRVRVGWGHWTIIAAVLECVDTIKEAGWTPDYVYHVSGSDYPIRPASELNAFLTRNAGKNFIEGVPADTTMWVKGGPQKERYQFRHYFSWRDRQRLSQTTMRLQRALRLNRRFVGGLTPYIGSQWWLLTWQTLQTVLEFGRRPDVVNFFKTTLIPDELYFQTLVYNLTPSANIYGRAPTLYQFSDYMVPVVFCVDRAEYLMRQPFFMARKISPHRPELHDVLDAVWRGEREAKPFADDQMGVVSLEYERTRLAQRDGLRGIPIVGKPPNPWMEQLERIEKPFFGVVGTSSAELRFAHALLSQNPRLACHGQLFHPNRIEFARDAKRFAGYGDRDLTTRNLSAPNFLADLIRTAGRQSGFFLRFGHGWHIPEVMFEHPFAKVMILHGDPFVGFVESLSEIEPQLELAMNFVELQNIPPSIIVARFTEYERVFAEQRSKLDSMLASAKRKGTPPSWSWLTEVDLDIAKPPMVLSRQSAALPVVSQNWADAVLARWRDWIAQAERCLGDELVAADDPEVWTRFAAELKTQQTNRDFVIELLKAGGREIRLVPRRGEHGIVDVASG